LDGVPGLRVGDRRVAAALGAEVPVCRLAVLILFAVCLPSKSFILLAALKFAAFKIEDRTAEIRVVCQELTIVIADAHCLWAALR